MQIYNNSPKIVTLPLLFAKEQITAASAKMASIVSSIFSSYQSPSTATCCEEVPTNDDISLTNEDLNEIHTFLLNNPTYAKLWNTYCKDWRLLIQPPHSLSKDCDLTQKHLYVSQGETKAKVLNDFFKAVLFIREYVERERLFNQWYQGKLSLLEFAKELAGIAYNQQKDTHEFLIDCRELPDFNSDKINLLKDSSVSSKYPTFESYWEEKKSSYVEECQWHTWGFLYYLRHPQEAPNAEWINASINGLTPLSTLTRMPHISQLWDQDPFSLLIEKGADLNAAGSETLMLTICSLALRTDCTSENLQVHVARAKQLLLAGASIPKYLSVTHWLRLHCGEELRIRYDSDKTGMEQFDLETLLPSGWTPPEWLPPPKKLREPIGTPPLPPAPSRFTRLYSSSREKLREKLNQHSWLVSLCADGADVVGTTLFILSVWDGIEGKPCTFDLTKQVGLLALALFSLPTVLATTTSLNQSDMKRLHAKALQNPLYAELWEKAQPCTIHFRPLETFLKPGFTKDQVPLAHCKKNNEINIYEAKTDVRAFEALIFETANAFQDSRFDTIDQKLYEGLLEREEYARLVEYVEIETANLFHQIMNYGRQYLDWQTSSLIPSHKNFAEAWESLNCRRDLNKPTSHADNYRRTWDMHAFLYYLRHPEEAPDTDWINKGKFSNTPLELLAANADIPRFWDQDPFILLIDKGADISRGNLLSRISCHGMKPRCTPEELSTHVARIKKLLEKGAQLPSSLPKNQKEWIIKHCTLE